jgi:hypothetical protein
MPMTEKGSKIIGAMRKTYGKKKGTSVFWASLNQGTLKGMEGQHRMAEKNRPMKRKGRG